MFGAVYTKNELGPYYIFDMETKDEKADLDERNTQYFLQLQLK